MVFPYFLILFSMFQGDHRRRRQERGEPRGRAKVAQAEEQQRQEAAAEARRPPGLARGGPGAARGRARRGRWGKEGPWRRRGRRGGGRGGAVRRNRTTKKRIGRDLLNNTRFPTSTIIHSEERKKFARAPRQSQTIRYGKKKFLNIFLRPRPFPHFPDNETAF